MSDDPEIYIEVVQYVDGIPCRSKKRIDLLAWRAAFYPGTIAEAEINRALEEVQQAVQAWTKIRATTEKPEP